MHRLFVYVFPRNIPIFFNKENKYLKISKMSYTKFNLFPQDDPQLEITITNIKKELEKYIDQKWESYPSLANEYIKKRGFPFVIIVFQGNQRKNILSIISNNIEPDIKLGLSKISEIISLKIENEISKFQLEEIKNNYEYDPKTIIFEIDSFYEKIGTLNF